MNNILPKKLFKRKLIHTSDTLFLLLSIKLMSIKIKCMVNTRSKYEFIQIYNV